MQAARPVLILDEPRNMESEKAVAALAALDSLLALRYSATHRNPYNVVYRITPAEAYRQGLVKKIEVDSVVRENEANRPYLRVEEIQTKKRTIIARLAVQTLMKSGQVKETTVTVRPGDSLKEKTNRSEYAGWEVAEINPGGGFVRFADNLELRKGEEQGADREAIFDVQIRHTVEEHMRKQARLRSRGIKARDTVQEMLRESFVVWTRWASAAGRGRETRYYALVEVGARALWRCWSVRD